MDGVQLLLVGLPLFLICSDLINLFTPAPVRSPPHHHHHRHKPTAPPPPPTLHETLPQQQIVGEGIGLGNTVKIRFCSSCSYRGTAVAMKKMLQTQFPGIEIVLENYPPPIPKRLIAKSALVLQVTVIGIVMFGEQIFPALGLITPPPWYYSLRANKFGTIASTWLLGNALQSFLHSSGAFEVYCNHQLVFSKLGEGRFPGEIELKDLVGKRLAHSSGIADA